MTQQEYEQKRRECWEEYSKEFYHITQAGIPKSIFYGAFDRAYALGQKKETISQEGVEKAAEEYVLTRQQARHNVKKDDEATMRDFDKTIKAWDAYDMEQAFEDGANFALGKQEKDAKEKKTALTDKEVYALESAISELESLIEGTLDEDYRKEQKPVISALKRIIKKYKNK